VKKQATITSSETFSRLVTRRAEQTHEKSGCLLKQPRCKMVTSRVHVRRVTELVKFCST